MVRVGFFPKFYGMDKSYNTAVSGISENLIRMEQKMPTKIYYDRSFNNYIDW